MLTTCERFGCLPSQLMAEDATLLRLMAIVDAGTPDEPDPGEMDDM